MIAYTNSRPWPDGVYVSDLFKNYLLNNGWNIIESNGDDIPNIKYDLCFGWGLSRKLKYVRDDMGTRAIVFDLGMVKRSEITKNPGYFRCGVFDEKWICPDFIDTKRWDMLDIKIEDKKTTIDAPVAFMGQVPGDVSHGMEEDELLGWSYEIIKKCKNKYGCKIIYRPHPLTKFREKQKDFCYKLSYDGVEIDYRDERIETLPVDNFRCVFTHCSTSGLHFIINGVPVVSSQKAIYSDLTSHIEDDWDIDYVAPNDVRLKWLSKIAYSQWNQEEISDGTMFNFNKVYLGL